MASKTTVAIDDALRKRIKRLAAWLDLTQGEIINNAINEYEKIVMEEHVNEGNERDHDSKLARVQSMLKEATERMWQIDPEAMAIQQRLMEGPGTIDDIMVRKWKTGLLE
ncbi:MAG TPA: ribbon-helix-helix protein, CopG family [Candidatus Lokiarchaeia archaeon]|nr:ribbon-helix-helix protein, CopG family [Candidatus Lokiarchaeia archaeon]